MKYNSNIYWRQVPEQFKNMRKYKLSLQINTLVFPCKKPNLGAFCGNNISYPIIPVLL